MSNENKNATDLADLANTTDALIEKLSDAMTPGFVAECDPDEAERAGAFDEDAMNEADAMASSIDLNKPAGSGDGD